MTQFLKKTLKNILIRILSIHFLANLLDLPAQKLERIFSKLHRFSEKLVRNIHRFRYMGLKETKLNVAMRYYKTQQAFIKELPSSPLMSILVPIYKVKKEYLFETLQSIGAQTYTHWEVCLVDDCSGDPELLQVIDSFQKAYPSQTKFKSHEKNKHISETSNTCLSLAQGEYVVLLDHDDRLYPNALAEAVRYINLHSGPDILYSDECTIDEFGDRTRLIYHKPDWSPFMHLTMNYTTHLSIYRRSLLNEIGGFRKGFEGSQDHDLMLRAVEKSQKPVIHIPFNLYQWRAHEASTAKNQEHKPYAADAGVRAVKEALARRQRAAQVSFNTETLQYRVRYEIQRNEQNHDPLVSIIIPSKDSFDLLGRCLRSVFEKSTYSHFEVIISDNGTSESKTLELYRDFTQKYPGRFHVLRDNHPFNFGRQVNSGAKSAKGEYLLLLNNDTEVLAPEWIEEMLSLAQFKEVGAVGAKLLFSNGVIQHAGVSLSAEMIAEHLGLGKAKADNQYWNFHNTVHEVSAVTAACLMISKDKYWLVGGLDAYYLPRAYGDIDFCLALRDQGLSNLFTPFALLYHHESASRGKSIEYFERFYLLSRRGAHLAADPYLNLNYTRHPRFEVDSFYSDLDLDRNEFKTLLKELCDPRFSLVSTEIHVEKTLGVSKKIL